MKVSKIVKVVRGRLLSGDPDVDIDLSKVSTDSRAIKRGEFFIALNGAKFNGGVFVKDAFRKGAAGALLATNLKLQTTHGKIVISVDDTTKALQEIAAEHRKQFKIPVVAVTGSNGKTTVKDMVASVLSAKYNVLKNEGTKNNHIGVPQTLLKLKACHQACVVELGTNHRGEIRDLSRIVRPTIAVITNIGPSHLEFLHDLKGVYAAKVEILDFLDKKGSLIINGDDRYLSGIKGGLPNIVRYGFKNNNDLAAKALPAKKGTLAFTVNGKMVFKLNLLGVHNIYNALAAMAVSQALGIDYETLREALSAYRPTSMRLNCKKIKGIDVIDDSYNSNPLSLESALRVIKDYPARAKWVVAGDMLELGKDAVRFHKKAGDWAAGSGISGILTFGELSRHMSDQAIRQGLRRDRVWHCSTHDGIIKVLNKVTRPGDVVLLKGSRNMKLEQVLEKFKKS